MSVSKEWTKRDRRQAADRLKAAFGILWNNAIEKRGEVTYLEIKRISDAINSEGPRILNLDGLPAQIESGLKFACAALDPDKARAKETIKQGVCGLAGGGGLALAWVCIGQLLNPGVWAIIVTFFTGGIAAGPMAIVGITAGVLVAAGAVYAAFQRMSPNERMSKAHDYVTQSIDNWIEYGSENQRVHYSPMSSSPEKHTVSQKEAQDFLLKNAIQHNLAKQDLLAANTLMLYIAKADGLFAEVERNAIKLILNNQEMDNNMNKLDALQHVNRLDHKTRSNIIDWCFQIAQADGKFQVQELTILQEYCDYLGCNFIQKSNQHGVKSIERSAFLKSKHNNP